MPNEGMSTGTCQPVNHSIFVKHLVEHKRGKEYDCLDWTTQSDDCQTRGRGSTNHHRNRTPIDALIHDYRPRHRCTTLNLGSKVSDGKAEGGGQHVPSSTTNLCSSTPNVLSLARTMSSGRHVRRWVGRRKCRRNTNLCLASTRVCQFS